MSIYHELNPRQKVWVKDRRSNDGKASSNGVITIINYEEREVVTFFYIGEEYESFSFDELIGNWNDSLGGYWQLGD